MPFVRIPEAIVPGAGAFEIGAYCMLKNEVDKVKGRAKLGVQVSRNYYYVEDFVELSYWTVSSGEICPVMIRFK